jgi:hypothetical protein
MTIIHCLDIAKPKISLTLNGWISTVENYAGIFNATKTYTKTLPTIEEQNPAKRESEIPNRNLSRILTNVIRIESTKVGTKNTIELNAEKRN